MIVLKHLTKSFSGHVVLNNINLSIQPGEILGIIGKSGAGKSTLLRTLNLLERPDSGEVIIDGQDWMKLSPRALAHARKKTAMIFQHFNLLSNKTVFENIALPLKLQGYGGDDITAQIDTLLDLVELKDKKHVYPSALSGGQKQRVAIARALITKPEILLCDEATSALDPETTTSILNLLQKINQTLGLTLVLITHEMDVVKRICHRIALIENGEMIEDYPLKDVFNHKNSLSRQLLFNQLSPKLPPCLSQNISSRPSPYPLVKILFEGQGATTPFISQTSRVLHLDINILLANIDRAEGVTFGVLIAELHADKALLNAFMSRCQAHGLNVEVLGYIHESMA